MDVHLTTDRLVLRRFTLDDVDALLSLDSHPDVRRFIEDGQPVTREYETETIQHWLGHYPPAGPYGCWAAVERSTGAFLGWFQLQPRAGCPRDEPELGYRLVPSSWGKGYATEGSRALIDLGFSSGIVTRVFAETMTINVRSRRVMEKVGMTLQRTFFAEWPVSIPGDEHGDVEYAITRDEWLATS